MKDNQVPPRTDPYREIPFEPPDFEFTYGADKEQFTHLYLPDKKNSAPVIVFFHGGWWLAKSNLRRASAFCRTLARAGFAVWSVEYRRIGNGGGFPATFQDVVEGTQRLTEVADRFALDLSDVTLAGHSVGGQLALWLAAQQTRTSPTCPWSRPFSFQKVVALAGVSDLKASVAQNICGGAVTQLLGGTPEQQSARYSELSPISLLPLQVPQVMVHGLLDKVVPFDFSKYYVRTAKARGDVVSLVALADVGHSELIAPASSVWNQIVDAFQNNGLR